MSYGRVSRSGRQGRFQQWRRPCHIIHVHARRRDQSHDLEWDGLWRCARRDLGRSRLPKHRCEGQTWRRWRVLGGLPDRTSAATGYRQTLALYGPLGAVGAQATKVGVNTCARRARGASSAQTHARRSQGPTAPVAARHRGTNDGAFLWFFRRTCFGGVAGPTMDRRVPHWAPPRCVVPLMPDAQRTSGVMPCPASLVRLAPWAFWDMCAPHGGRRPAPAHTQRAAPQAGKECHEAETPCETIATGPPPPVFRWPDGRAGQRPRGTGPRTTPRKVFVSPVASVGHWLMSRHHKLGESENVCVCVN